MPPIFKRNNTGKIPITIAPSRIAILDGSFLTVEDPDDCFEVFNTASLLLLGSVISLVLIMILSNFTRVPLTLEIKTPEFIYTVSGNSKPWKAASHSSTVLIMGANIPIYRYGY